MKKRALLFFALPFLLLGCANNGLLPSSESSFEPASESISEPASGPESEPSSEPESEPSSDFISEPLSETVSYASSSSSEAPLEIHEVKEEGPIFCDDYGGFSTIRKVDGDYWIDRKFWSYPQEGDIVIETKLLNVRAKLVASYYWEDSYYGIPDQEQSEWTFETGASYRLSLRFTYTFQGTTRDFFSDVPLKAFALSLSEDAPANVETNILSTAGEGDFTLRCAFFDEEISKRIQVRRNAYPTGSIHTLTATSQEWGLVSVSPSKSTFREGDEYEIVLGVCCDGPGYELFINGFELLPALPNAGRIQMPPFDCHLAGMPCYTYFPD